MEKIEIEKNITVFFVAATSFPDGVLQAHQTLHSLIPFSKKRRYFGLSRPEGNNEIVYKAAAEEINNGETQHLSLPKMEIKAGTYYSVLIKDYVQDTTQMASVFKKILHQPDIDPNGYCVELYLNDMDVQCMVRIN